MALPLLLSVHRRRLQLRQGRLAEPRTLTRGELIDPEGQPLGTLYRGRAGQLLDRKGRLVGSLCCCTKPPLPDGTVVWVELNPNYIRVA